AENLSPEAEKQVSDSIRREDPLPPPEAWGYSDGALKVMLRAAREFLQKEGENGGSVFPQESSSIVLPLEPGEKISRESGGDEKSASESPESAAATQNMPKPQSSTEQLWQERWDRADAALRVEMSRMWEYCQHYLMYRGYFFAGVPLEELMLTKSSYERFKPTEARSPSDWIELIRSMGLVPDLGVLSRLGVMAIGP
ncbi:MAG: hypothetical protein K8R69_00095, partial [Deltaproteobacteria bacterium]|nr:hypothetical protein [Deltaproteobacteria bacterium]